MDTTIEQSTATEVTFTASTFESSSLGGGIVLSRIEEGNGVATCSSDNSHTFYTTADGGILPRHSEGAGHHVSKDNTTSPSRSQEKQAESSGKLVAGDDAERRYKLCLRAEIVGLCVVIVIVWGLLLLPIIFYHIQPTNSEFNNANRTAPITNGSGMGSCDMAHKYTSVCSDGGVRRQTIAMTPSCALPVTYRGAVCQEELRSLRSCLLGEGKSESIYPQIVTESNLAAVESIFPYIDEASPACAVEVRPFLCLYFFGLCDSSEMVSYQPSASHCRNLQDNVCAKEWELVGRLGQFLPDVPALPNCEVEFSEEAVPCDSDGGSAGEGNLTESSSGSGMPLLSTTESPTPSVQQRLVVTCNNITCRNGFYCSEGRNGGTAVCIPSCHSWNQYPHSTNIAIDFLVLTAACIGLITGVGVLIVAGLRWKKVLIFPSSLAVYQTITLLVLAFFVIVNYMDNSTLYCTSVNLFESLEKQTAFCVITGAVFYYSLLQLAVFWLCHVSALFWKIKFPFHSRSFQMAHRVKYVHIAAVVLSILVPFTPVVAIMSQYGHRRSAAEAAAGGLGFGITRFPPLLCVGRHGDTTFYSLILPILVILMVGMTMLVIIFFIIHRQHGLFKARQSKNPYKIGTAERKILIVFVYYVVLAVIALTAFTLTVRDEERFTSGVLSYFECESKGVDVNNPCDSSIYIGRLHVALTSLSYILLGLFPMVNFIFVINVRELKQYLQNQCPAFPCKGQKKKAAKFQPSTSDTPSSTSSTTGMLPITPQTPREIRTFTFK